MKTYRAEKRQKAIKDYSRLLNKMLKTILIVLAIYLAIDVFSFIAWIFSNQMPVDSMYAGAITKNIINLFIN